jgi:acetyl esterase
MTRRATELDEELREIEAIREARRTPDSHAVTPETAREQLERNTEGMSDRIDTPGVEEVNDFEAEGPGGPLHVRAYHPDADAPHPVTVFFHGGGFVYGSPDTHDNVCRYLTDAAETLVLSVNYRKAPEHPFPAAVEDAYAAVEWAERFADDLHGDPDRLAVAGDSAGGNLAAAVSLMARDRQEGGGRVGAETPNIDRQVLVYPWLDPASRFDLDSYEENRDDDTPSAWLYEQYAASDVDAGNTYFAPLVAEDCSGLPPTTIVTAGFDALRDEGFAYADRLEDAGVEVTMANFDAMNHGFVNLLGLVGRAHDAADLIAEDLRATFGE